MKIRPMRWWDIPDVHAIETEVFPVDAWRVEQFWSELAQPTRAYLVAEDDGIVGYGGVYLLAPDSDVQTIAVAAAHHGKGVGRALLDVLMERAHDAACTSMMLEVRSDNAPAIEMYRSAGFEQISRRSDYYAPGVDALIMRRRPLRRSA
jgi:ribosomal-protein-alanine N-acetyltransferase